MNPKTLAVLALAAATALAGCGRMGDLEPPAARNDAAAPRDPDENIAATANPKSARDRATAPAPPRTLPIEGQGSDPFAVAPQGALPDPYANPQ